MSDNDPRIERNEEIRRDWKKAKSDWHRAWKDESWWEARSMAAKVVMGIVFGLLFIGFLVLLSFITMWLWNWLMPEIFGLVTIDYWQTWGLLLLSFIFFKNWGGGNHEEKSSRRRKKRLKEYMKDEFTKEFGKEFDKEYEKHWEKEQAKGTSEPPTQEEDSQG